MARTCRPGGGQRQVGQSSFNLSDAAFVPIQLNWSLGNFSFKLAEVIIAPTGAYDVDEVVNLGRNYGSFGTLGAMTWLDPAIGTELSLAPPPASSGLPSLPTAGCPPSASGCTSARPTTASSPTPSP